MYFQPQSVNDGQKKSSHLLAIGIKIAISRKGYCKASGFSNAAELA